MKSNGVQSGEAAPAHAQNNPDCLDLQQIGQSVSGISGGRDAPGPSRVECGLGPTL